MSLPISSNKQEVSIIPPQIEVQGPISGLPPELIQRCFSFLDQSSKKAASLVNNTWLANVISEEENEKSIVEKLVNFIDILDKNKFSKSLQAISKVFSKNTWLQNIRVILAIQLSEASQKDLQKLQKLFFDNQEIPSFFAGLPDLALIQKRISDTYAITDPAQKASALYKIAIDSSTWGYHDKAIAAANLIPYDSTPLPFGQPSRHVFAIGHIATDLSKKRYFDRAIQLVTNSKIPDVSKSFILCKIIENLLEDLHIDKAHDVANLIPNPGIRSSALFDIERVKQKTLRSR